MNLASTGEENGYTNQTDSGVLLNSDFEWIF